MKFKFCCILILKLKCVTSLSIYMNNLQQAIIKKMNTVKFSKNKKEFKHLQLQLSTLYQLYQLQLYKTRLNIKRLYSFHYVFKESYCLRRRPRQFIVLRNNQPVYIKERYSLCKCSDCFIVI